MLIKLTEQDPKYIVDLTEHLINLGAKSTNQPNVLEVEEAFDVDQFHGVEKLSNLPITDYKEEIKWLHAYHGNFEFYLSLKTQYATKGRLSDKQWASVTKAIQRDQAQAAQKVNQKFSIEGGTVIVLKKYFAHELAQQAGCVRPHYAFEVVKVQAETEKAYRLTLKLTAQRTTHCSVCGIKLTNKSSVSTGIGPICAEKWGIPQTLKDLADKLQTTVEVTSWLPKTAIKERFGK